MLNSSNRIAVENSVVYNRRVTLRWFSVIFCAFRRLICQRYRSLKTKFKIMSPDRTCTRAITPIHSAVCIYLKVCFVILVIMFR